MSSTAIAEYRDARPAVLPLPNGAPAVIDAMEQLKSIRTFIAKELHEGIDFGPIPGTDKRDDERGPRKVMLQPGAQKVAMFLNVRPEYEIRPTELGSGHVEYLVTTALVSRATDRPVGEGIGSATTMESKHRFRNAQRSCPACGKATIIRTKKGRNPGGYWCVPDKGGCGANFNPGDKSVEGQQVGRVENDNIYDQRNTVLKMAKKRSFVDACIGLACLTDEFTQDLDDTYDLGGDQQPQAPAPAAPARPEPRKSEPRRRSDRDEAKAEVDAAFAPPGPEAPGGNVPRTGKAFFAWAKDAEERHEVGLVKYLNGWAKLQEFPARMVDWDAEQVADGYAEAVRKLQSIRPAREEMLEEAMSNAPAPAPAAPPAAESRRPTLREYLEASQDFSDFIGRASKCYDRIEPGQAEAKREGRILNRVMRDAAEAAANGHIDFDPRSILKPAEAGKEPARDSARAWNAMVGLWNSSRDWVVAAVESYLDEKREAAEELAESQADH